MIDQRIEVLIIEDDPDDAFLVQEMLADYQETRFVCTTAERLSTGCEMLSSGNFDVVLLDLSLPDQVGLDAIQEIQAVDSLIPIIVLTGYANDELGAEAITRGAQDYLAKGEIESRLLIRSLRYAIERKRTQQALRDSEEIFRTLTENSQVGIYIIQGDVFQYMNPAGAQIFGYTPDEIVGKIGPLALVHPDDVPVAAENIANRIEGKIEVVHYTFRGLHKDGREIHCEVRGARAEYRGKPAIIGTCIDITDRKKAEEGLVEERNLLQTVIEMLPINIFVKDREGRYLLVNPAHSKFIGIERDNVIGKSSLDIHPSDLAEGYIADDRHVMETGETLLNREEQIENVEGRRSLALTTKVPLRDRQGEIIGLVGISRDMTEIRETQAKLEESQKILQATLDALSGGVALLDESGTIIAVNEVWRNPRSQNKFADARYTIGENYVSICKQVAQTGDKDAVAVQVAFHELVTQKRDTFTVEFADHLPQQKRWFTLQLTRFEHEGAVWVVIACQNITERVQAEVAEREQRILAETIRDTVTALTSTLNPDAVMSSILENVGRVVPHKASNIMLIEGDAARISYMLGYPNGLAEIIRESSYTLERPILNKMLMTGKPYLITDTQGSEEWTTMPETEWVRSYAGVPIKGHGQVIGFLNLESDIPHFFTQTHIERLEAFAEQAAVALQNAQMYDTLNDYASEITMLYRTTSFLFSSLSAQDISALGKEIVGIVVRAFGQVDCGIMLVDSAREKLIRLARMGEYEVQAHQPLYLNGRGLAPEAVRTRQTIYVPDVSLDTRYVANEPRTRSEMVIPLQFGDQVIGVLDLQSSEVEAFTEREQRMLEAYAERAAAAIENMRLYEKTRRYADELEQRVNERTAELQESKERVEAILNSTSDAVVLTTPEGYIRQMNPAFDTLFLFDVDEPYNWMLEKMVVPDHTGKLRDVLEQVVQNQDSRRVELAAIRKDGTAFDADVALSAITETTNQVTGVVCSFRDITDRKQIEESLRQSLEKERELGELKSRFVSMASHEFRTPLATIQSSGDLLKMYRHRMEDENIDHHIGNIHKQVEHMTQLLEDILTIGQAEAGRLEFNPEPIDIEKFCRSLVEDLRAGAGRRHEIVFTSEGTCMHPRIDKKLMRQALENLVTNAFKYSEEKSNVYFHINCADDTIIIQVKDMGIGIPEKDLERIFETFHRAENVGTIQGTGLGLAIALRAVERHGGSLHAESQVGKGSNFIITLPVQDSVKVDAK